MSSDRKRGSSLSMGVLTLKVIRRHNKLFASNRRGSISWGGIIARMQRHIAIASFNRVINSNSFSLFVQHKYVLDVVFRNWCIPEGEEGEGEVSSATVVVVKWNTFLVCRMSRAAPLMIPITLHNPALVSLPGYHFRYHSGCRMKRSLLYVEMSSAWN
ncbi:hypothetical protein RR46_03474 [Papilio xuthus]|uniref:Uncharacterized protein n=1 Tax=Papilio xuthus TaxID=66420 RepID=A0A194Q9V3_PAPXU|nr:hypothetical protein RR46_03474 [Papilio xuthus]